MGDPYQLDLDLLLDVADSDAAVDELVGVVTRRVATIQPPEEYL